MFGEGEESRVKVCGERVLGVGIKRRGSGWWGWGGIWGIMNEWVTNVQGGEGEI